MFVFLLLLLIFFHLLIPSTVFPLPKRIFRNLIPHVHVFFSFILSLIASSSTCQLVKCLSKSCVEFVEITASSFHHMLVAVLYVGVHDVIKRLPGSRLRPVARVLLLSRRAQHILLLFLGLGWLVFLLCFFLQFFFLVSCRLCIIFGALLRARDSSLLHLPYSSAILQLACSLLLVPSPRLAICSCLAPVLTSQPVFRLVGQIFTNHHIQSLGEDILMPCDVFWGFVPFSFLDVLGVLGIFLLAVSMDTNMLHLSHP
mmetsp:Transcript_88453/g.156878  ORF Transcript_88453/g.156878 Transcript_88453/m.156878 type:complete len:257 (-) Transcript_88453:1467-2237(-)